MRRRRYAQHPFTRLAAAMRVAALNINIPVFRKMARTSAETIPVWICERGQGKRADMARRGRALLATLPDLAPEQYAETQTLLRGYADAVMSRFEVTEEVSLGARRRA